jgi:hypothetical protein
MFDVGDPVRNAVLTVCFAGIVLLAGVALFPWKHVGAIRMSNLARWVVVPVLALAIAYESAMPTRFDIRVDLLLLLPLYAAVAIASVVRWRSSRAR